MLNPTRVYGEVHECVTWEGQQVDDGERFKAYLAAQVSDRVYDVEERREFENELRALATTDMESETLELLLAAETGPVSWEIGEALAECLLEEVGLRWPWNTDRDKRTPRASLPGADLIGFAQDEQGALLALGEVKTSDHAATPPGTMTGRTGMIQQLEDLATKVELHRTILRWLRHRCKNTQNWPLYQQAAKRYLRSRGKDFALYGMLMRDTNPSDLDLRNRAIALSAHVSDPTKVFLAAWYLPVPIATWVTHARNAA